jgi:hypothetical protein
MNLVSTIFLTAFITSSTKGQSHRIPVPIKPPTEMQLQQEDKNHSCLHRNRYSEEQRLQFYPFNRSAGVKLVSFDNKPDANGTVVIGSNKLPMKNGAVDYFKLDEVKDLSKLQVDTLTDILYNTGYMGSIFILTSSGCYNPRNAILFVDKTGKTFAFLELCFECSGYRRSSEKVKTGDFCNEKYELLKNLFHKAGIEIGITKGIGLNEE